MQERLCYKAESIYYLVLYRKSLSIPSLLHRYYHDAHFIDEKTEFSKGEVITQSHTDSSKWQVLAPGLIPYPWF